MNRLYELRDQLHDHNYRYYVLNDPIISDFQFDLLMQELQELESKYPSLYDSNSPTQRVGGAVTENFETSTHQIPLYSLQNTYSKKEIIQWIDRMIRLLGHNRIHFLCELKFDGVSINLQYKDGQLMKAITRGDGQKGDDVTTNVRTISSIPLVLKNDFPNEFEIRGEILLNRRQFNRLNASRKEKGLELYRNPRNTAAGTLKLQDSSQVAQRRLSCFCFSVVQQNLRYETQSEMLQKAKQWGFKIFEEMEVVDSIEGIWRFIEKWELKRKNLDFEIDGVVIKANSLVQQHKLGETSKFPRWAIAFKFPAENISTILKSVTYQVGKTGAITPVAELLPVILSGTQVKRASLHNADQIGKLDLRIGDWVYVEKGGEIIPKITGVDHSNRASNKHKVIFPNKCPECRTPLTREKDQAIHYCPNSHYCKPQIIGKIQHYISRNAMDIKGIGDQKVVLLYENQLIKNIADLYSLTIEMVMRLPLIQSKSAQNMIEGIQKSKNQPLWRFIFGLGIRHVGETASKQLAKNFQALEHFISATYESLIEIEDIGEIMAHSIISYFKDASNCALINQLKSHGLPLESSPTPKSEERPQFFKNKKVVVSGVFENYSRQEIKQLVEDLGGQIVSSVSKRTGVILIGQSPGASKISKAKSLGISILTQIELEDNLKNGYNKN
ncbi:MAG: NAD-dependent DNA ligase LigA [Flavobacteriaceae bacterium]|nr:NAD-dependent DNA ligase LigA [Flavobacteriaceae bacterium]MCY4267253.1 NAD-dependent DNA ligase LigA [Flavobacteriaceae bacterium]MCY4299522.1 NAD-dependent DNA ligase LigA [Flavobacteriaceae bacterium]